MMTADSIMMKLLRKVSMASVLLAVYTAVLVPLVVPYGWIAVVALLIGMACKKTYRYSAYGTARWADASDIPHLLEGDGLVVGYLNEKPSKVAGVKALFNSRLTEGEACRRFLQSCQRKPRSHLVRLTNAVHVAAFSPPGGGKSTGLAIPFLLTCRDSMVVVDFKGELVKATLDTRRRFGHRCVVLDPFRLTTTHPDTFNPIEFIDATSSTAIDECLDLAAAMVVRTGHENDPHWADSAELWIASLMAMVVSLPEGENKSLQFVREILSNPEKKQAAIKLMCDSDVWEGMLSRLGYQLTNFKDKELASTLTKTNRFMRFLDTVTIAESTRESSFNPAGLLTGKMTIYLVLPPEHMRAQSALLRMWIGSMLRAVVKGGLQDS
jgi:type IV secretion system protein VirD4